MSDLGLMEGQRRLTAIMFTDTVGFTALAQQNEEKAMSMIREQRDLVRPIISRHKGKEVKTMGDAFLVEFASALDAVDCAGEIQEAVRSANDKKGQPDRYSMRIGIHLGDVMHAGGDVAGDAVNLASRIEPLAPPGGICVTGQVRDSVLNKTKFRFDSLGTPKLKNVTIPLVVYQVAGFGEKVTLRSSLLEENLESRMAVLPLRNISADGSEEYFADGLTEELISSVSRTQGLKVIARTSVMKYKGTERPVSEIGRELGVGYVLEGSVRKAGNMVRITVQLVSASTQESKWSQQYDREMSDIFAIQSDIAMRVAGELRLQIGAPGARQTTSTEAYIDYLRGRQSWNRRTEEGLTQAIGLFERALAADGTYAKAFTGLADSYATLALLEFTSPVEAFPKAKEAAGKALSLDSQLGEAHTSLGLIRFQYDWDWKGAEEEFMEAIRISPSYAPAHHFYADFLKAMGRFEEALSEIQKARELDPLNLAINTGVGHVLYLSRQYDRAIDQYRRAVDIDPAFMLTHIWFGRPYLEKGMYSEAIAELETAVELSGEGTLALAMLGHALASAGRRAEAEAVLGKLLRRSKERYVPSYWIAVIYNGFKDRKETVSWLRTAFKERSSWLVWCNVEPRFDWLRDDPGFSALMKAMKFP